MNLRISVTYPATDGSMPENVEVEWGDVGGPAAGEVSAVLETLILAPAKARELGARAYFPGVRTHEFRAAAAADPGDDVVADLMGRVLPLSGIGEQGGVFSMFGVLVDAMAAGDRMVFDGGKWRQVKGDRE